MWYLFSSTAQGAPRFSTETVTPQQALDRAFAHLEAAMDYLFLAGAGRNDDDREEWAAGGEAEPEERKQI